MLDTGTEEVLVLDFPDQGSAEPGNFENASSGGLSALPSWFDFN